MEITNMLLLRKMSLKGLSARSWFSVEKTWAACGGWCVPMKSVCESESLVDLLWILMLILCPLCFSFWKTEAVMLPFFSKAVWGWYFGSAAEFSGAALSAGCWQCLCSCMARGTPCTLQRLQFSGMGNCRTQLTQGKGWSQAKSKYLLQGFFCKPPRRRPTPFLICALLSPSAIYAHLHFGTLRHPLAAWAISGRALKGHLPQNVLIIFYSHLAGQHFTLMLPSVHD